MTRRAHRSGFTIIELLVVVAIIAILAAIAVPSFLHAQTRSKIARVKNDQRVLAGALEAYFVDRNAYPQCNAWAVAGARPSIANDHIVLERLSTPVAYLTSAFVPTPFVATRFSGPNILGVGPVDTSISNWPATNLNGPDAHLYQTYNYTAVGADPNTLTGANRAQVDVLPIDRRMATAYITQCAGPMLAYINMGGVISNADTEYTMNLLYDPTNGATSFGNIFRVGGKVEGENNFISATRSGAGN